MRPTVFAALAAAALAALPGVAAAQGATPSIVFVLTDDETASLLATQTNVRTLVQQQGATFTHAYYNDPLCAPSRATVLTGMYRQNTGLETNSYLPFVPHEGDTVAVALHAAGYRTGHIGKYVNGYPGGLGAAHIPPGWDTWFAMAGGDAADAGYYGWRAVDQGAFVTFGTDPASYSSTVLGRRALAFVRDAIADGVPFYLDLAVHAPHVPMTPAPGDEAVAEPPIPRTPAFNEADVSDKPAYVQSKAPGGFSSTFIAAIDHTYMDMARSLRAVDRAVGDIVAALDAAGRLDDTYIVYTSDNGWMTGQHRIAAGKGLPYEEAARAPLVVRGPGIAAGRTVDELVGNADLGPTFADWGGTALPNADGRSLVPLLAGNAAAWRHAYPTYYLAGSAGPGAGQPTWSGVATDRYRYVEYADGERELYDITADPNELTNIAATADPGLLRALHALDATLAGCAGDGCRAAEDGVPAALWR